MSLTLYYWRNAATVCAITQWDYGIESLVLKKGNLRAGNIGLFGNNKAFAICFEV